MTTPIHSNRMPSHLPQRPSFSSDEIKKIKTIALSILTIISMLFLLPVEISIPFSLIVGCISHLVISNKTSFNTSHTPRQPPAIYSMPISPPLIYSPASSFTSHQCREPLGRLASTQFNPNSFHRDRTAYIPPINFPTIDPAIREKVGSRSLSSSQFSTLSHFPYTQQVPTSPNHPLRESIGERNALRFNPSATSPFTNPGMLTREQVGVRK